MSQELYTRTRDVAVRAGVTVGETIRNACRQFNERESQVKKAKIILSESTPIDMRSIHFSGNQAYVTNKMSLYLHKNAYSDMKTMGDTVNDTVMEFMRSSMSDGTLLSKGRIETSDGTNIISFKAHLFDIYCQVGPGQITILSVS